MPETEIQQEHTLPPAEGQEQPAAMLPAEPETPSELPEDASERTKQQFEKLKEQKRQLAEENAALKASLPKKPSVYDTIPAPMEYALPVSQQYSAPPQPTQQSLPTQADYGNLTQQQIDQVIASTIDQEGVLDVGLLRQRLTGLNQHHATQMQQRQIQQDAERRAREAEIRAKQALDRVEQFEVSQATRELHREFPELDPESQTFNPEAFDLVKNELLNQLIQTGKQDGMNAAKKMAKFFRTKGPTPEEQAQSTARAAAATTAVGRATRSPQASDADYESLKQRSRHDKDALAERLARNGY